MSILIYQQRGHDVDWVDVDYIGPFRSQEAREAYKSANPLPDRNYRYVTRFLRAPNE